MSDLTFTGTFGGEIKKVKLHQPAGSGYDDLYHVMVDGLYYGRIWKTELFGWQNDVKPPFSSGDIETLIKAVTK